MEIELNFVVLKLVNTQKKIQKKVPKKVEKMLQKKKVQKTMLLLFDDN